VGFFMVQYNLCTIQGNRCHQTCSPAPVFGTSNNSA